MSTFRYASGDRPLDGFTIEYGLGRGGFGEVYFAKSDAGREVALKVIQNYEDIELRGVSHCMNLKSPHLVTIFDVKKDAAGRPWVVMEYVAGPCLKDLLDEADAQFVNGATSAGGNLAARKKGIGEDQALYFMRELIKGMRYLHDSGVVHRDLKPHNIFFEDGSVKIGDYSLSKAISTSHRSGHTTTVGSVHYMAPEIGEGKYGKAVDIYALGVIFYEMLTGNPPYVGQSMGEVLIKHLTSEPDVSDLKSAFGHVITKAMARQPEDRFQSVDEMLHALCPEDHSNYLPAPASLSMIGDRASARRVKASAARQSSINEDTFTKNPSLVDTKEDFQSQPFERPGTSIPDGLLGWLNKAGLWWQPPTGKLLESDPVPTWWRICVVVLICCGCVVIPAIAGFIEGAESLMLMVAYSIASIAMCFAFRQLLPLDNSSTWNVVNRLIGAGIVIVVGAITVKFILANGGWRLCSDDHIPIVFISCLFIDWRCFISIDRYPRVGFVKTLAPPAAFILLGILSDMPAKAEFFIVFLWLGALSTQILAPHGRARPPKSKGANQNSDANAQNSNGDSAVSETRFESDSFSIKENV